MDDLKISLPEQELIKREILHKEAQQLRNKRKKISARDFEPITIIGRGAFGEVRVCRWKDTGEIVAMKKMNKHEMLHKNQVLHIRAERDVLATAHNPWIVELKCSFQDEKYLYLVMEYLAGGDLMTLLMKKDILSEEESKFYIAEAILAVESVHKLNYIHRDLKPDNILLDARGHIKLSDFGLCKHTEIKPRKFEFKKVEEQQQDPILTKLTKKPTGFKRNRQLAYSTVGTPDYIAPEVFGQNGYTETVDWWSLGVILYEMLVGYPPFFSEDPSMTCQKILHWRKTLVIPAEANLSPAATDILRKLITDANERLGVNGVEEIKAHPFFCGIDWKRIRERKAPNIPEIKSEIDTSNFDKFEEEEPWYVEDMGKTRKVRKDVNFIGYTFKRDIEAQRSLLVAALQELEANKSSQYRPKPTQTLQSQNSKKDESFNNTNTNNTTNNSNSTNPQQSNLSFAQKKSTPNLVNNPNGISTNSTMNNNTTTTITSTITSTNTGTSINNNTITSANINQMQSPNSCLSTQKLESNRLDQTYGNNTKAEYNRVDTSPSQNPKYQENYYNGGYNQTSKSPSNYTKQYGINQAKDLIYTTKIIPQNMRSDMYNHYPNTTTTTTTTTTSNATPGTGIIPNTTNITTATIIMNNTDNTNTTTNNNNTAITTTNTTTSNTTYRKAGVISPDITTSKISMTRNQGIPSTMTGLGGGGGALGSSGITTGTSKMMGNTMNYGGYTGGVIKMQEVYMPSSSGVGGSSSSNKPMIGVSGGGGGNMMNKYGQGNMTTTMTTTTSQMNSGMNRTGYKNF